MSHESIIFVSLLSVYVIGLISITLYLVHMLGRQSELLKQLSTEVMAYKSYMDGGPDAHKAALIAAAYSSKMRGIATNNVKEKPKEPEKPAEGVTYTQIIR